MVATRHFLASEYTQMLLHSTEEAHSDPHIRPPK